MDPRRTWRLVISRFLEPSCASRLEFTVFKNDANGYPVALSLQDAFSVRTMSQVKVIDFVTEPVEGEIWVVRDDFSDLGYVPYGDPLFYLLTVSREVNYNDRDGNPVTESQLSDPSKLTVTNIVENYNPESPGMSYTSDPLNVTMSWNRWN